MGQRVNFLPTWLLWPTVCEEDTTDWQCNLQKTAI